MPTIHPLISLTSVTIKSHKYNVSENRHFDLHRVFAK